MNYAEFAGDEKTLDAVERNLITIGEAAGHIPEGVREENPDVPWSSMRGMRNVAAHRYFGMDTETVWDTVKQNLPPLVPKLRSILESGG
ncbi:MAG: DUF86 domain-containing protein [Rubrobacter sp.]|jgi:uncharacterized protein with HEPN domain|nr:DUF86 domain-containing protein [Rubrobacter sp.]